MHSGGSLLAEKLVDIYFTTFRLILEGRVGQKVQQARSQTAKLPPDKRAKADKAAAKAKEAGADPKQVASHLQAAVSMQASAAHVFIGLYATRAAACCCCMP